MAYAVYIWGSDVANSLYARAVGILRDGVVCAVRFTTLGVGSSTLVGGACCGVILSKIAAKYLIACILSEIGCLNGVSGAACMIARARFAAAKVVASALDKPGTLQCCGMAVELGIF
jgi:hypothetical protein